MKKVTFLLIIALSFIACEKKYSVDELDKIIREDKAHVVAKAIEYMNLDSIRFDQNRSILHHATAYNAEKTVKQLLKSGFEKYLDSLDGEGNKPLHIAVILNDDELSNLLLENDRNIDAKSTDGYTPLYIAAHRNNFEIAKKIIDKGADINLKAGIIKNTVMHIAIENENLELIDYLLQKNASDTIKNTNKDDVLTYAYESPNPKVVNLFFNKFSKKRKNDYLNYLIRNDTSSQNFAKHIDKDWVNKNRLQESFIFVKSPEIAKILLSKGVNIKYISKELKYGAMHHAAVRGDVKMLNFLLENNADINQVDKKYKHTPLLHAAALYDELLIEQEIGNLKISSSEAMKDYFAISNDKNKENSLAAVELLLEKGANINYKNNEDTNALYIAESTFNTDVADLLKRKEIKQTKKFVESKTSRMSRMLNKRKNKTYY